jgi:hypothetical protein
MSVIMMTSRWRRVATPIIKRVIAENLASGGDEETLAKALQTAYPFGLKECHPYKIWRDEIRRQLGKESSYFKISLKPPYTGKLVFGERPEGY